MTLIHAAEAAIERLFDGIAEEACRDLKRSRHGIVRMKCRRDARRVTGFLRDAVLDCRMHMDMLH